MDFRKKRNHSIYNLRYPPIITTLETCTRKAPSFNASIIRLRGYIMKGGSTNPAADTQERIV